MHTPIGMSDSSDEEIAAAPVPAGEDGAPAESKDEGDDKKGKKGKKKKGKKNKKDQQEKKLPFYRTCKSLCL